MARWTIAALLLVSSAALAQTPVGWRGDGSGVFAGATGPTKWEADKPVWKTKLPSWSNSSPIVVGDKIFVCAQPTTLVCLSAADGKILWSKTNSYEDLLGAEAYAKVEGEFKKKYAAHQDKIEELTKSLAAARAELAKKLEDAALKQKAEALAAELRTAEGTQIPFEYAFPQRHAENGFTTPTPASDGKLVYVVYGTGVAAAYDLEGNRKWIKMVEHPPHAYGLGSSPVVVGDKLIVHINSNHALDCATGKTLWTTPSGHVWGTPARAKIGTTDVVVTANGQVIRVSDGKQLAAGLGSLGSPSPIVDGNIVYFIQEGGRAVKLPSEIKNDQITVETLWTLGAEPKGYYASPVLVDGLIYAVTQNNILSVIDAKTGKEAYRKTLELGDGYVFPSLASAGKNVYICHTNGTVLILEAGKEYKEVAKNKLEMMRSCPTFAGKRMYVRGLENLWCIE